MSQYRFLIDAQKAHIVTLRVVVAILVGLCGLLFVGWQMAPSRLTVHVPPDLRTGSTRLWWDIPPENVYGFALYIFSQLNRWPVDGERDAPRNLYKLQHFVTPTCRRQLEREIEARKTSGELKQRVRGVYEILGHGYADNPTLHVQSLDKNTWKVVLDIAADEYYQTSQTAEPVKRALVRYPIRVVRKDVDAEKNPWGLAIDCYTEIPQRIEIAEESK